MVIINGIDAILDLGTIMIQPTTHHSIFQTFL